MKNVILSISILFLAISCSKEELNQNQSNPTKPSKYYEGQEIYTLDSFYLTLRTWRDASKTRTSSNIFTQKEMEIKQYYTNEIDSIARFNIYDKKRSEKLGTMWIRTRDIKGDIRNYAKKGYFEIYINAPNNKMNLLEEFEISIKLDIGQTYSFIKSKENKNLYSMYGAYITFYNLPIINNKY